MIPTTAEFTGGRTLNEAQLAIVQSYQERHGIEADQISFDGEGNIPSFDHNAISTLSLKLTDIRDISPTEIQNDNGTVTVFGRTVLPDDRTRGWIGSCTIGEVLANGQKVENTQVAIGVATSRGFRQGIRNVGIDLHKAHLRFLQTGEVEQGHTKHDPRKPVYAEIHLLATQLDLIVDGNKDKYRTYIAETFDGIRSAADLNDLQLHQLLTSLRAMAKALGSRSTPAAA
jgi:hypothetical protein